ncbi:hypothetical protein HID58_004395 [Brassica napus]|uniref:Uncharacterized protein n=1 Tax=Brassica napus TaxID=3708 RepID=A0ABQ8E5L5_BRANA|nr:hypothetical protein HID58_004395 [Brassica napus]
MYMYEEERNNIVNNQEELRLEMAFPQHGFMFQQLHEENAHHLPSPTSLPSCPPHLFYVLNPFMNASSLPNSHNCMRLVWISTLIGGGGDYMMNRSMSFTGVSDHRHLTQKSPTTTNMNDHDQLGEEDNLSDDGSHMMLGEKKKRLNLEQLVALKKQDRKEPSKIKRELAEASWSNNEGTDNNNNNNSDINHVNMIKDLFPSSVRSATTTTTSSHIDHQMVQDQGFCNMFNGIDETTSAGYWAWSDQQQQHQSHHQFN